MSTINDLELTTCMQKLFLPFRQLEILMRDGREMDLFIALSDIDKAARQAQDRLTAMRFSKGKP